MLLLQTEKKLYVLSSKLYIWNIPGVWSCRDGFACFCASHATMNLQLLKINNLPPSVHVLVQKVHNQQKHKKRAKVYPSDSNCSIPMTPFFFLLYIVDLILPSIWCLLCAAAQVTTWISHYLSSQYSIFHRQHTYY